METENESPCMKSKGGLKNARCRMAIDEELTALKGYAREVGFVEQGSFGRDFMEDIYMIAQKAQNIQKLLDDAHELHKKEFRTYEQIEETLGVDRSDAQGIAGTNPYMLTDDFEY